MSDADTQVMAWGGIEFKGSLHKDSYIKVPVRTPAAPKIEHTDDGTCLITVPMNTSNNITEESVTLSFKSDSDQARFFEDILAKGLRMEAKLTTKDGKGELEIYPVRCREEVGIEQQD